MTPVKAAKLEISSQHSGNNQGSVKATKVTAAPDTAASKGRSSHTDLWADIGPWTDQLLYISVRS